MSSPELLNFKPSCFYFRRALRETDDVQCLIKIVRSLMAETAYVTFWARNCGLRLPPANLAPIGEETCEVERIRALGFALCIDLEVLKEAVRAQGAIPPKRHIMRSEAEEKGWEIGA